MEMHLYTSLWFDHLMHNTMRKCIGTISFFLLICFQQHIDGILPKDPTRHAYAWQVGPFGRIPSTYVYFCVRVSYWGDMVFIEPMQCNKHNIVECRYSISSSIIQGLSERR